MYFVTVQEEVLPEPEVDGIKVSPMSKTLEVGETFKIKATTTPSGVESHVIWTADNEDIIDMTVSGKTATVTAKETGTVYVVAQVKDNNELRAETIIKIVEPAPVEMFLLNNKHIEGGGAEEIINQENVLTAVMSDGTPIEGKWNIVTGDFEETDFAEVRELSTGVLNYCRSTWTHWGGKVGVEFIRKDGSKKELQIDTAVRTEFEVGPDGGRYDSMVVDEKYEMYFEGFYYDQESGNELDLEYHSYEVVEGDIDFKIENVQSHTFDMTPINKGEGKLLLIFNAIGHEEFKMFKTYDVVVMEPEDTVVPE